MYDLSALGGTGDMGAGIIKRAALAGYSIVVGSRKEDKAKMLAEEYREDLEKIGIDDVEIAGMENQEAAKNSEIVIVTIPYKYAPSAVEGLDLEDKIVISPLVPMKKEGKNFHYTKPEAGSASEELQANCEGTVISAFQNVPASPLNNVSEEISCDVLVCGEEEEAKEKVMNIVNDLSELRALDGGDLSQSSTIESITPLLVNLAINNKMRDVHVHFKGE